MVTQSGGLMVFNVFSYFAEEFLDLEESLEKVRLACEGRDDDIKNKMRRNERRSIKSKIRICDGRYGV
jgi:hypothetical protein